MTNTPDTNYVKTPDGVFIAYQAVGEGPVDVAMGFNSNEGNVDLMWEEPDWRPFLTGTAQFARLILHDRRATGVSSRNVPPPNLETQASDLLAGLDVVGSARPILAGGTQGGQVHALFAATHPDRVAGLAWNNPAARTAWAPDYPRGNGPEEFERSMRHSTLWGTADYGRHIAEYREAEARPSRADHRNPGQGRRGRVHRVADAERDHARPRRPVRAGRRPDPRHPPKHSRHRVPSSRARHCPVHGPVHGHRGVHCQAGRARRPGLEGPGARSPQVGARCPSPVAGRRERHGGGWVLRHVRRARRAIRCALEISDRVRDLGLEIRGGVHTGECELIDGKCAGITVSNGARIASNAGPSQILVSQKVKDLVAGSGVTFHDAGERVLKGIPDRWRLYLA